MENFTIKDLFNKKLESLYITLCIVKNEVKIKRNEVIEEKNVYSLVGVGKNGRYSLLNIIVEKQNASRLWLDTFETLKTRGIVDVLYISVEDNKEIKRAAKIAFPTCVFIDSITGVAPIFYRYSSERGIYAVVAKIKKLYTQKTLVDYESSLKEFTKIYPSLIHKKLQEKYLKNVKSIYKYNDVVRKFLFNTSKSLKIYDIIRLKYKDKYISGLEQLLEELDTNKLSFLKVSPSKKEWNSVLVELSLLYPEIDFIT